MSLTGPDFWSPEGGTVMAVAIGHKCFVCGAQITRDPAWTWAGETGQIWAHIECVADWQLRLASDVLRWQKQTGRRFRAKGGV